MTETRQNTPVRLTHSNEYHSPENKISRFRRKFPSCYFYARMVSIVLESARAARSNRFSDKKWAQESRNVLRALEAVGVQFHIENLHKLKNISPPCVFVANHMSTLETFVLPCILVPEFPITYVVKESLVNYPIFKHVMLSCDPIVVSRTNAREDLVNVLKQGSDRLRCGISVVIFPQRTRRIRFDPRKFNTIGIKLAQRAKVPVVPVALRTDAWGNARHLKDFGPIRPGRPVFFDFGDPLEIHGRGRKEHHNILDFIQSRLDTWGMPLIHEKEQS